MPRILMLTPDLEHTGPTYNALTLARALRARGNDVLVVATHGGQREPAFEASRIPCIVAPHLAGLLRGRRVRRQLQRFGPQVIHALDLSLARLARRLARACAVPYVVTVNHLVDEEDLSLLKNANCPYIAVSDAAHARLVQLGSIPRDRVHVIHNGVDLSRFRLPEEAQAAREPGPDNRWGHTPVVGALGSLRSDKGRQTFLQAAGRILERRPVVEFVIMGRGPELPTLKTMATELHIADRVTFTSGTAFATAVSRQADDSLEAVYLRDFDIFVEPSLREGLGLSVLQAMAWGRPVIASGVGGLYSLVENGVTGILVQKESPDALAEALEQLLADPARAEEMGRLGRERIEANFDIRKIAGQHLSLYEDLGQAARDGGA